MILINYGTTLLVTDEQIELIGMANPELKSLTDMFNKTRSRP